MKKNNLGISIITLIITIIVIIILASIVLFSGLDTPEQAAVARFVTEFSDFELAINNDYAKRAKEYALDGKNMSNAQIYYMIATGQTLEEQEKPVRVGLIEELEFETMPVELEGTEYYEITNDKNVANWGNHQTYYVSTEKHYVTDAGEAFVLPGYMIEEDGVEKWWINDSKYYENE